MSAYYFVHILFAYTDVYILYMCVILICTYECYVYAMYTVYSMMTQADFYSIS